MMHICLICIEMFGDSIYGGFGRSTRFLGRELARRGVRVTAVVPRRSPDRPDTYEIDGIEVRQFAPWRLDQALRTLRRCGADVYHSQDISTGTWLARVAAPNAAHVVTFRDPMDRVDWDIETKAIGLPWLGWRQYRAFIDNPLVRRAVRNADARACAARFLSSKAQRIFNLPEPPRFLPSPVAMPQATTKAERPTVCYVGRWEGRKRVTLFFELARCFPEIEFVAMGGARDAQRDDELRARFGHIPNLYFAGVLDQFRDPEWSRQLGRSWILVNTSAREGLPTTFVEAAGHRCAILSFTDPDGFALSFGVVAQEGRLDDGLRQLLADDRWREAGNRARAYVESIFATDVAVDAHLAAYDEALQIARKRRGR